MLINLASRYGAAGEAWTPAELFVGGKLGGWHEPSLSTSHTDAAGTTLVTTDGDPVGNENDRSPNSKDLTQATASRRPAFRIAGSIHYLQFDDVDDQISADKQVGVLTVMLLTRRINTNRVVMMADLDNPNPFFFAAESGSTAAISAGSGTPTHFVDGTAVSTRGDLHNATSDLGWHVLEAVNVSVASWTRISVGGYTSASFRRPLDVAGLLMFESTDTADRASARQYLADLVRITL